MEGEHNEKERKRNSLKFTNPEILNLRLPLQKTPWNSQKLARPGVVHSQLVLQLRFLMKKLSGATF